MKKVYSRSTLEKYSEKICDTEKIRCENAIDMVKDSLKEYGYTVSGIRQNYSNEGYAYYYKLIDYSHGGNVTLLIQGSYANNTNIKRYSDVDVSIIFNSSFPISLYDSFDIFKTDICKALRKKFESNVQRKNKSIRIEGNSYRKSIDVVPAFSLTANINDGIKFITDKGKEIFNYPLKQITNENKKNKETNYKFKKYVRILKNIREDMIEDNYDSAKKIGSFQIESLLWNVDNNVYSQHESLGFGVYDIIKNLKLKKYLLDYCHESNGIKKLCDDFSMKMNIQNFIDDLEKYYEYEVSL